MNPVAQPEKRLYYLDWLRVLIIGGVFLAHTVLPFTGGDWLIVSGSLIPIAGAIAIIGNQFGMPLLFLISGAATVFSMRRRINKQYARERFFRLIIPYIVLTLILSPMQAYYQALDHGWYSGSFIGYLPEFFNLHGITGFNLQWAGRYGFHLWFLVFLFFYSIVTIPLFTYLRSEKGKRWFAFFDRLFRLPGAIVWAPGAVMGVLTGIVYAFFPGYQNWGDTVYWGLFFVYGYILYSDPRLLERVRRSAKAGVLWIVLSIVALVAVALLTLLSIGQISNLNEVGQLPTIGISIVIYLILCLNSWAFMILFLALGMRFLDFTNRALQYLGEAAMPFYLLHHPVIVFIAFYVTHIPISPWAQLITIGVSAFLITGSLYHLFIRRWNPLRAAMGMSRLKPGTLPTTPRVWAERVVFGGMVLAFACVIIGALPLLGVTTFAAGATSLPAGWTAIAPGGNTICANGAPYEFFTRPVTNSQKLMIYFQAGGACWNATTCDADSLLYAKNVDYGALGTYRGIFDFNNPENPVADYNIVFITYCSADVHTGSRSRIFSDAIGVQQQVRFQGYLNSLAVLQWTYAQFPQPEKILLTGSSAGAMGSIFFAEPIMRYYADVPVVQLGDGYVGVMPRDWPGLDVWGTRANLPGPLRQPMALASPANFATRMYASSARAVPQRTFGQFTTAADAFQIGYFAVAGGQAREWPDLMWQSINGLNQESNFRSYVADGADHTILAFDRFYTTQINGVRFRDWFASLIGNQPVSNTACARGSSLMCP
jgi:peptidoglycan/LPS O-acetylase OafA/YrhL